MTFRPRRVTTHPCKGMTKAQRRDFELICIGQSPRGGYRTIKALKARGLIEDAPPRYFGRDRFGPITIPDWQVPLLIHRQWCQWCDENVDEESTP